MRPSMNITGPQHFFDSLGLTQGQQTLIYPLLQEELPRIIEQRHNEHLPKGCLLADIGDFLVSVMNILSDLAHAVVNGDYILEYVSNRMSTLAQEDDLHTTDYLDDKHAALKNITSTLHTTANSFRDLWQRTPPVPPTNLCEPVFTSLPIREVSSGPSTEPMMSPFDTVSKGWQSPEAAADYQPSDYSEQNVEEDEGTDFGNKEAQEFPSIEQLRVRGKGSYTCPHGESCKKGGYYEDGRIRIFTRNSEYRAHLLKHEKTFRCDLHGCQKGFARPDQLERHKKTVRHLS